MQSKFKYGEIVVFNDEKYVFEGVNPDGSYLLKRCGSSAIISAPADKVTYFLAEGRVKSQLKKLID